MTEKVCLNGTWKADIAEGFTGLDIPVPGCWENIIDRKDLQGPVRIYRTFRLPECCYEKAFLRFGAVSYFCEVSVNGCKAGEHEGLWDGFRIDITGLVQPACDNLVELLVWKPGYQSQDRFPLRRVLSGFIPDVCCSFGGIWDDVALELTGTAALTGMYTEGRPDGSAVTHIKIANYSSKAESIVLKTWFTDSSGIESGFEGKTIELEADSEQWYEMSAFIANPGVWEPGSPALYTCHAEISGQGIADAAECRFGFREIRAEGTGILLNGNPVYPRGLLHWGYYDEGIIPNPSRDSIDTELDRIKAYGFNMVKHCLYIPREEYLRAADEAGVLLWVELPLWIPEVTPQLSGRILREYPAILRQLAGHPSVVLLSLGCELDSSVDGSMLERMYLLARSMSTALIRDNSGSGECYGGLQVDFADYFDYHFYAELQNFENLVEVFTPQWRSRRPWLFGEFCDSDTLRDLRRVRSEKGAEALWWESGSPQANPVSSLKLDFRLNKQKERFEQYGIDRDSELLERLSIRHAMLHRKMTLEFTRAFPEVCGYNITSIRDVPISL